MTINERIKIIRKEFFNNSNIKFAEAIGSSRQYASNLCNGSKSIGKNVIASLSSLIPNLNTNWLLTGEGHMLNNSYSNEMPENLAQENATNYGVTKIIEPTVKDVPYFIYKEQLEENKELLKKTVVLDLALEENKSLKKENTELKNKLKELEIKTKLLEEDVKSLEGNVNFLTQRLTVKG